MYLTSKSGKRIRLNMPEEDAQITAAALTDPDNLPLTDAELAQFKPARGRPLGSGKKEQVTFRLDTETLKQFRATGSGWQTRINDALLDWSKHPILINEWLNRDLWSRREAVQLLAGSLPLQNDFGMSITEPRFYLDKTNDHHLYYGDAMPKGWPDNIDPFGDYPRLKHPLRDEVTSNLLVLTALVEYCDLDETRTPREWIDWAESKGFKPYWLSYMEAMQNITPTATPGTWVDKARAIADRIALERYERGEGEITQRNICDAVALELAKDTTTWGTHGARCADSIRCAALKGWKFIPPTGTNGTNGTEE